MSFIKHIIFGIAIGAGAIIPGISSGVLCVIFGIYERLLNCVLHIFKDFKNNFKFLFPIFLGTAIGVLLFSNILNYLLYSYPLQLKSIFIGFILGCIPNLLKNINSQFPFKYKYLIFLFITLFIGIFTIILENYLSLNSVSNFSNIYLFISGFVMSLGIIVPGVSSTIILMLFGIYSIYLNALSYISIPILIPIGLGVIVGSLFWIKITSWLLNKFYPQTFYSIIGFSLGSVFILFPTITSSLDLILGILCILVGFFISYWIKTD